MRKIQKIKKKLINNIEWIKQAKVTIYYPTKNLNKYHNNNFSQKKDLTIFAMEFKGNIIIPNA